MVDDSPAEPTLGHPNNQPHMIINRNLQPCDGTEISILLWPPYGIGQAIIFLPCGFSMAALRSRCGHYIFVLFLSSFFYSLPNLSSRRLDVYRTSTHSVALVRI